MNNGFEMGDDLKKLFSGLFISLLIISTFVLSLECGTGRSRRIDCQSKLIKVVDFRKAAKESFCKADKEGCEKAEMKLIDDALKECLK
jgi:hypothetical protein